MVVSDEELVEHLVNLMRELPEDKYLPKEVEIITSTIDRYRNMYLSFFGSVNGDPIHFRFKAFHLRDLIFLSDKKQEEYRKTHGLKIPEIPIEDMKKIVANAQVHEPTRIKGKNYEIMVAPPEEPK